MAELTLEDIAKLVGVSRSTVSRVVNGSPNVSQEVRQRVLKVIQSTGFQPNAAARSLASQRSRMIGLVLPRSVSSFFTDPFFPQLTQGIAFGCNNNDLTLSLFLVGNKEDEEKIYPRISRRGLLDGILVQAGQPTDKLIPLLFKSNLPTVMIGRPFDQTGINYIDVDNVNAASKATTHLVNLGYKRIATITGSKGSAVTADRLEGYKKAIENSGATLDEKLVVEGDFTEASGYNAMKELLPFRPDAVFAGSDVMAAGAIRAAQEAGLQVPEDMGVVGFDDVPLSSITTVQLTTIRQPILRLGIKAVELLMDIIDNGITPARRTILDTELVIRESCGARKLLHVTGSE
jgi:LacI family transcriptional regulator